MPFSRRRSLAIKIPAVISALLLAALVAVGVASYLELGRALIELAAGRLQEAADQMAGVFGMSVRQRAAAMKSLMQLPEVHQYLQTQDAALRPAVESAVRAYLGTSTAVANVELWDVGGKRVFEAGAPFGPVPPELIADYEKELAVVDEASIGRLRQYSDGLRYSVGGPVSNAGQPIGYVVERRSISNPSQTRQTVALLTGLIGNDASMLIGNADGSIWSTLSATVSDVPITGGDPRLWEYQRRGMPPMYAAARSIPSTPWIIAIEFPRAVVLAPLQRFLINSSIIGTLVLLIAAAIGWTIMRRITTPLIRLTRAAEAMAESKPHERIDTDREDEVGRLADAFNAMAERVELARLDLELRVETRTSELQAANRELEAFSYSVSHDLRAPLRAIAGFVQILEEDHAQHFNAEARRALERVSVNARRMGQLIDDLLTFSRIGRSAMMRQSVDLTAIATTVATEAIAASGRAIDLRVDPLPACYGEPTLLNQVLHNLISNAVKFTAKTPNAAITISSTTANGETIYYVRDNGAGFDERYAEKLFGVFQRLHRIDDFEGTGVGLAIVHRIITRHGGRVWAEGKLNGGATFYFTLPSSGNPGTGSREPEQQIAESTSA